MSLPWWEISSSDEIDPQPPARTQRYIDQYWDADAGKSVVLPSSTRPAKQCDIRGSVPGPAKRVSSIRTDASASLDLLLLDVTVRSPSCSSTSSRIFRHKLSHRLLEGHGYYSVGKGYNHKVDRILLFFSRRTVRQLHIRRVCLLWVEFAFGNGANSETHRLAA